MRKDLSHISRFLIAGGTAHDDGGQWIIPRHGVRFIVIASWGMDWDHVSISLPNRCPTWDEMCWIRSLFFAPDEWVIQYHPPEAQNISNHPNCLHLWRPQTQTVPTPPAFMVGIPGLEVAL